MKCNLFLKDMRWNLFLLLLKICIYCVARKELLGLAEQLLDTICKCALSLRYKAVAQQLRPSRCQSEQWNFSWQVRSTTMTFSLPVNYFIYSKRVLAGELLGWHSPWRNWESLSLAHKTWYSACDVSGPVGKGGLFLPFWLLFWGADIYPWLLPVPHTPQSRCIWTLSCFGEGRTRTSSARTYSSFLVFHLHFRSTYFRSTQPCNVLVLWEYLSPPFP